ncbi:MAG: hypothetical protein GC191_04010 [Azospirillum sp.]|nr:hypothetical protein [Azospirillum sp.]
MVKLSQIVRDRRGIAAVELAFVVPVLLALMGGIVEIATMVLASSKTTAVAQTIADLVSRYSCVTDSMIDDIFDGAKLVLSPFKSNSATFEIASVEFDKTNGAPQVKWHRSLGNGSASGDADLAAKATNLGGKGDSVIIGSIAYEYSPILTFLPIAGGTFAETAIVRPRLTNSIPLDPSCP